MFHHKAYERNLKARGIVARIERASREQQIAAVIAEGDPYVDNRQWQPACDMFCEAQRLTSDPDVLQDRIRRARNGYIKILSIYIPYRDSRSRIANIDATLTDL